MRVYVCVCVCKCALYVCVGECALQLSYLRKLPGSLQHRHEQVPLASPATAITISITISTPSLFPSLPPWAGIYNHPSSVLFRIATPLPPHLCMVASPAQNSRPATGAAMAAYSAAPRQLRPMEL